MATPNLDDILTQAEALKLEEQLLLLARLAEHVRVVYSEQPAAPKKLTISERLAQAGYTGGRLFKTAEEVDAYIREERDFGNISTSGTWLSLYRCQLRESTRSR